MALPACSRGLNDRFFTVLPHCNIILQAKDMTPQLVTYDKGPRGSCASIEIYLDLKAKILKFQCLTYGYRLSGSKSNDKMTANA